MIKLYNQGKLDNNHLDCFISPRPREELYDVINDPFEFNNLAFNENYSGIMKQMNSRPDQWIMETHDTIPLILTPDRFDRWTGESLKTN